MFLVPAFENFFNFNGRSSYSSQMSMDPSRQWKNRRLVSRKNCGAKTAEASLGSLVMCRRNDRCTKGAPEVLHTAAKMH